MDTTDLAKQVEALLGHFPAIRLVYLFGSQVSGQTGPLSDYDFAIYAERGQSDLALQTEFQYRLSKLLETDRVDVVLLQHAPIELAYAVIAKGRLLYQQDLSTRIDYEAYVLGMYGDYLPTLRAFERQILQGDAHGQRAQRYRQALRRTERTLGSSER